MTDPLLRHEVFRQTHLNLELVLRNLFPLAKPYEHQFPSPRTPTA